MKNGFLTTLFLAALMTALLELPVGVASAASSAVVQELDGMSGYAGQSAARVEPGGELNTNLKYAASLQVSKDLLLRIGAEWQRFSFMPPRAAAVPASLQQASAMVGFDCQLAEQWLMRAELQPGMYGDLSRLDGRHFDIPLVLGFVYLVDADLQWLIGLRVDFRSQYPVFPAAGVRWKFDDLWTLDLMLPNPRLEYDVNSKLQAYVGADILAGTYVVGDHFGDDRGLPQLNHATLDYMELHLGPGLSWKVRPNLTLEADAGYVVYRSWDFFDQHINPTNHPVPYLQLGVKARF
jgi:Domain of unknown function (DUF6268)